MVKRQARSARGIVVDFDLLKIKNQIIQSSPASLQVDARQEYIDRKLRRKIKKVSRKVEETKPDINIAAVSDNIEVKEEIKEEVAMVQGTEDIIKQKTK